MKLNPSSRRHRALILAVVAALCVACDQVTKALARRYLAGVPVRSYLGDLLRLHYSENAGAFLSLGAGLSATLRFWLLIVGVAGVLVGFLIWAWHSRDMTPLSLLATGMILGGGLSNWIDRLCFQGRVVDFLNVGLGRLRTGIFNVADVAIMAGVGLLLLWSVQFGEGPEA